MYVPVVKQTHERDDDDDDDAECKLLFVIFLKLHELQPIHY